MTGSLPDDPDRRRFLLPFVRVVARSDADLRRLLTEVAREAAADVARLELSQGIGASVRANQLRAVQGTLAGHLAGLWRTVGDTVRARREEAIKVALDAGVDWDRDLLLRASSGSVRTLLRRMLKQVPSRNFRNMLARYTRETIPLSQKVYRTQQLANGQVDHVVTSALGRGLSARELAKEVRGLINPNTPGGVSYAAMRLARTEINAANKFASEHDNAEKPFVDSIDWRLSGSHPTHERDVCDDLAENGPYPKDEVPEIPHPQCFCYQVPNVTDEDDFIASLQRGTYDKYFSEKYDIGDEFADAREEQALAPVAAIIERQPEPEVEKPKARGLDLAGAAFHAQRLLGDMYVTQAEEDRLRGAVMNLLEGIPESKVERLTAIRIGNLTPGALAEYHHPPKCEIRVEPDLLKPEYSEPAPHRASIAGPGWFSDSGDQNLLQASLNHEMGHHLDLGVGRTDSEELLDAMFEAEPGWAILRKPGDPNPSKYGMNGEWVVNNVGAYADTNLKEFLAELYAQYRGEGKQSKLSKIVGEWFHRETGERT